MHSSHQHLFGLDLFCLLATTLPPRRVSKERRTSQHSLAFCIYLVCIRSLSRYRPPHQRSPAFSVCWFTSTLPSRIKTSTTEALSNIIDAPIDTFLPFASTSFAFALPSRNGLIDLKNIFQANSCQCVYCVDVRVTRSYFFGGGVVTRRQGGCKPSRRWRLECIDEGMLNGHSSVVEVLLREGKADLNQTNINGWNALMCASRTGNSSVVEVL